MNRLICVAPKVLRHVCSPLVNLSPVTMRSMASNTGLSISFESDFALINMNKNDNRMNQDFLDEFHNFLDQVEGNPSIRGVITTGHGKFYSNGLDLDWMNTLSAEELVDFMKGFQSFVKRLLLFPIPTLAALNGHTFAGGAIMAYAQDFRVMNADKGWICLNEVHLHKRFYGFMATVLRSKIGTGLSLNDATVFGSRYTADEAISNRLIHSKSPSSNLLEHSINLLKSYTGKNAMGRNSLQNVKEDIYNQCLIDFEKYKDDIGFAKQFMTESQISQMDNDRY